MINNLMKQINHKSQFTKVILDRYELSCQNIAIAFNRNFFNNNSDMFCVAEDPTGVWCIADYFFSVNDMYEYLKYKYTRKMMFEHYDYALKIAEKNLSKPEFKKEITICIRDYKKLKK